MSVVSRVEVPALVGALLDRYREYLTVERGLRPLTIRTYLWNARLFVLAACGDDVNRIGALTPCDVARSRRCGTSPSMAPITPATTSRPG
jgi:hypothetical protein